MKKTIGRYIAFILSILIFLPVGVNSVQAEGEILRLMATSDLHNRFVAYDYATNGPISKGGFSRVATAIEQNRTANTVLIDNGDTIQGNSSMLFNKDEVQPMVKALNLMKYDTYTSGNHEYNYGMDYFEKLKKTFTGNFLTANVYKGEAIPENRVAKNYSIIEKNGIKTAVIGVVTPHIKRWDAANLEGYTVTNPYDEVKTAVSEIKSKNLSDVIVVSFHASIDGEYGQDSAKELANLIPEVDVVIAGHAHETRIEYAQTNAVIIEPGSYGSHISMVDLHLTKTNGGYTVDRKNNIKATNLIVDNKIAESQIITTSLSTEHKRAVTDASTVIGTLSGGNLLPSNDVKGIPQSQLQDNALIDLILETQIDEAKKGLGEIPKNIHHVSSAAVFNTSTNVLEGAITKGDVSKIYQFDNTLETISINGAMLRKLMEDNMRYYNQYQEGDLTVSFNEQIRAYNYDMYQGVNYTIDISKPVGQRLTSLTYSDTGQVISDTDSIYFTANNYRASGLRTTYPELKNAPTVYASVGQQVDLIRDMIGNRITREKVIKPVFNKNWQLVHPTFNSLDRQLIVKLVKDGKLTIPVSADGRTPNVRALTSNDIAPYKNTVLAVSDDFSKTNPNDTTPFGYMVTTLVQKNIQTDGAILKKLILPTGWTAGNVTAGDIYAKVPFSHSIGAYTVSKSELETIIKDNIDVNKLNIEYSGFAVETAVENNKITIKKITKSDGTPLPEKFTIALSKDVAEHYKLQMTETKAVDLQDVLINTIEPLEKLSNEYVDLYTTKTVTKPVPGGNGPISFIKTILNIFRIVLNFFFG